MTEKDDCRITPNELYKELWHCRDFEIDHLWQRSVFLATFLLAIAAGYGTVAGKIIFNESDSVGVYKIIQTQDSSVNMEKEYTIQLDDGYRIKENKLAIQHFSAACLCYLGLCFSILWVMMSKGAKYWYESYEQSINAFINIAEKDKVWDINSQYPRHGRLDEPINTNSSLFSPRAYTYSVSKINCTIGIIGIICWLVLSIIHMGKAIGLYWQFESILKESLLAVCFSFVIFVIFYAVLALFCKSGE